MRLLPSDLEELAEQVIRLYAREKKKIVTAESCTGGLIAGCLTAIPGSSEVLERGFISYSNDAKTDLLGVLPEDLRIFGAVSAEVAEAMAQGALEYSLADVALAVTGIAGPGGATSGKPVGLVYFGIATREGVQFHYQGQFPGNRDAVRHESVRQGLSLLLSLLSKDRD